MRSLVAAMVVNLNGYILTSQPVIENAQAITVRLSHSRKFLVHPGRP
jgi:S1-C subfamily serine protease